MSYSSLSKRCLSGFSLLLAGISGLPALRASPVAEWRFEEKTDASGGESVKLHLQGEGAGGDSILRENSFVSSGATGLGNKWQPFLAEGYLEANFGAGIEASADKDGLVTRAGSGEARNHSFASYFGFTGFGAGADPEGRNKGVTAYLVLSPADVFKPGIRYGFLGCGHAADGGFQLGVSKSGQLHLSVGGKSGGVAENRAAVDWKPGAWYFVAASWHTGEETLLYVREMDAAGLAASPPGIWGTPEGVVPSATRPDADPIVLGANWYDPGAGAATIHGAGSRIAFARFDNAASTREEIEEFFKSLASP